MSKVQDVRSQVMALSVSERASLAHELILSLDEPGNFDLSPQQESEIQRRLMLVKEGKASGRPADEVFSALKARRP